MRIGLLDPGISSKNVGDEIISQAALDNLQQLSPGLEIERFPTHSFWSSQDHLRAQGITNFFFGGSNVFAHNFPLNFQWKIGPREFFRLRGKVTFLGVGSWQDGEMSLVSRRLWSHLLSSEVHSMRDSTSLKQLEMLGFRGVNTGCPTLWKFPTSIALGQPKQKCIVTITDYNRDAARDSSWVRKLSEHYELSLWPQGSQDVNYASELGFDGPILESSLNSFDEALRSGHFDYFGTRLHGGIRALSHGVRAGIIEIDNRARDMGRDFGLPTFQAVGDFGISNHLSHSSIEVGVPRVQAGQWLAETAARLKKAEHELSSR
jgi:polysaccharide pyruvyl transferase WcaK-like protein